MSGPEGLKEAHDGLSKVWKVHDKHEPFYSGGHVEVVLAASLPSTGANSSSGSRTDLLACMYDENVKLINWSTGQHIMTLLPEEDENRERVSVFCMHPTGLELVLATASGLLRHFSALPAPGSGEEKSDISQIKGTASASANATATATASASATAKSWVCVRAIKAHTMPVLAMAYDLTGTLVATGSADRTVKVWDIARGYCTHSFKGHTDIIHSVKFHVPASAFSGRGGADIGTNLQLYSTAHDCTVKVYDLNDSKCVATHKEHMSVATALATASASGDEYLLASVGRDKVVNFYETRTHTHLHTAACMDELEACVFLNAAHAQSMLGHAGGAAAAKKHVLVVGGSRGVLRFFAVAYAYTAGAGSKSGALGQHAFTCDVLSVMPVSGDAVTKYRFRGQTTASGTVAAVTAGADGSDASDVVAISNIMYQPSSTYSQLVAVTADQAFCCFEFLNLGDSSKVLSATEAADSKSKKTKVPKKASSSSSKAEEEGERSTAGGGGLVLTRQLVGTHDDILDVCCLATHDLAHGGRKAYQLAIASNSPYIRLTDMLTTHGGAVSDSGGVPRVSRSLLLYGHADLVLALDGSPDGRWLVSSSKDRTVRLWDLSEGGLGEPVCAAIGVGHTEGVGCVCLSTRPNAYAEKLVFAFSASGDKIIKRWSLRSAMDSSSGSTGASTGAPARQLQATHSVRGHEKDINTVALSPNDALLASGSQDKTIRIWKADDLQAVATLRGHKRGVWKVAFSSIDKILCSGSGDRTVRLWSMSDYSCLKTLEGHSASVLTVRFVSFRLPPLLEKTADDAVANMDMDDDTAAAARGSHAVTYNSLQLLSGSADGLIRLWDVRSGEVVKTFDQHSDKLWALSFPKDGGYTPPEAAASAAPAPNASNEIDSLGAFFVTAGSDARMLVWTDATTEEERSRLKALETRTIAEQSMDNDMRAGRFDKALNSALELGHSHRTLKILTAILEQGQGQGTNPSAKPTPTAQGRLLCPYVRTWSVEQLEAVSAYLLEWNTNARYAFVSQCLLHALLETHGSSALLKVRGLRLQLTSFIAYSERHFQRIDRLHQAAYLLEYMSSLMSLLPQQEEPSLAVSATAAKGAQSEGQSWEMDGTLDIFGSGAASTSKSASKAKRDDHSDSDSDGNMRAAAQSSFSGLVVGSSDDDNEDEASGGSDEDEEEQEQAASKSNKRKASAATPSKHASKSSSSANAKTQPHSKHSGKERGGSSSEGNGNAKPFSSGKGKGKGKDQRYNSPSPAAAAANQSQKGKGSAKKRRRGPELSL